MSFLDRLFGIKAEPIKPPYLPQVRLGRYTDSYKEKKQYTAWDAALTHFEQADYLGSYLELFKYIRDDKTDNVRWIEADGTYEFEILQGSKRVTGKANAQKFTAEARIAHAESLSVAVMRRLVESNFTLRYSRFALDNDNNLVIKFDSAALDASPYKLYYALKEVAINADKQDDLLLDEFRSLLKPIDMGSKIEISTAEKEAKYTFLMGKIQGVLAEIDTEMLDAARYPGGISYLLLNLAYTIDYLITPEGFIMETIERIHRSYFAKEGSMLQKNITIRKEFEKIINRDKTLIFNELYNTTSTFGVLQPKGHEALVSLIDGELQNMNWYEENKHMNISLSVPSYIVGHALFCYTLPKPDRALLELYYQIFEPHYFNALGGEAPPQYFEPMTGIFDPNLIKNAIIYICNQHIDTFPKLLADVSLLNFKTPARFAATYLMMLKALDFTPKD